MRKYYWSCTKLADWIRGTPKPSAETSSGWKNWHKTSQKLHPVRHWIAEEGLDHLQNTIYWIPDRLHSIKYYINNRWITRTHALTAHPRDIERGTWRDLGDRFLPCLFNELVDFVEVELAWWHIAWSDSDERKKYNTPWWAWGWWRIRTWRCAEAGLDNLKWQCNLVWAEEEVGEDSDRVGKPTDQAVRAQEVLALYRWWKEVRPLRPDPHDAGGWTEYMELRRKEVNDGDDDDLGFLDAPSSPEMVERSRRALDETHRIEEEYETEDTEMLVRLIKVRRALWT